MKAADAAAKFVADVAAGRTPYWLTILGHAGTGKTMLAKQILAAVRQYNPGNTDPWVAGTGTYEECNRRPLCQWFTAAVFAVRMRDGEYDLPEYLRADFIVILDDLGATRDKTDFLADGIYRLADQRIGRWMVWTSNLPLDEINRTIDMRVSSRLIRDDNRVVTITAPDYALRKR